MEKSKDGPSVADIERKRKQRNAELIRKMKAGESLASIDLQQSWFPNRPVLPKDKDAINKLYEKDPSDGRKDGDGNKGEDSE